MAILPEAAINLNPYQGLKPLPERDDLIVWLEPQLT